MYKNSPNASVICSLSRALLGAISHNLRGAAVDFAVNGQDQINTISLYFYFFTEPSEEDLEDIDVVGTEVTCDFPHLETFNYYKKVIPIGENLPSEGLRVFQRK